MKPMPEALPGRRAPALNGGVMAALLTYGLWGVMPLYFRLLAPASAIEVVAHRVLWSLGLLLLWLGLRRQLTPLWQRIDARLLGRLLLAAVLVAINWLTYVWAVTHGRTLDASLGYFLLPLFNVALGVLLLGERLVRGEWLGVGLAATGVVFLALVSPRLPWVALVLAASFSTYGLVKKRTELPAAEGMALETGLLALPALAVLGWLAARGQLVFGTAGAGMDAWLVSTGLITTVPLVAFAIAARRLTLAALGMLQYISPTLQFLLGVLVLQEPVDARRLAGFAVVWLGLIVFSGAAWRRHRAKRQEPPAD